MENHVSTKKAKNPKFFHTFLRNQNKFYVNAFNIIDRKAAIMIRINSMIIPVIFFLSNYMTNIVLGKTIGIILILTSVVSLVFAINGSRPYIFGFWLGNRKDNKIEKAKLEENIFIVNGVLKASLDEYREAYDKVINNNSLQVENQIRATYKFDKYLQRAFTQIELSYIVFIFGFVVSVIVFLFGYF